MPDFFEKAYYHEFERKDKITSGTSISITVITAIGGGVFYIADSFIQNINRISVMEVAFSLSFALCIGFLVCSSVYFIRVINSVYYEYLDDPKSLKDFYDKLEAYYKQEHKAGHPTYITHLAQREFDEYLKESYAKCATINYKRNVDKGYFKDRGQFYLFLSMPFVVLCALLLLVSKFSEREFSSINGAECGAIVEWKMTDDDKKPAEQEAEPVKLDKPVGPPTRQYKDGFDPRRIKNSDE
ncbi:MAG: hypothetical protein KF895_09225 [Parvibaculum sp.]|nr:hypothetical protein [Parvibaculum sp.]